MAKIIPFTRSSIKLTKLNMWLSPTRVASLWDAVQIKEYAPHVMEIKRMYTTPESRGKGIASKVLTELESWATELLYEKCILETGKKQPEAIGLYKKNGYKIIPNYGQYAEVANSLCFEKNMTWSKQ